MARSLSILLLLMALCLLPLTVCAADADPLHDFCIADINNTLVTLNGFPCKPAGQVQSLDFKSTLFRIPGKLVAGLGSACNLATAATFPALNTQGLSGARIDFQPKGLNPPHVHPRATELLFLAQGTLVVGFVSTAPDNTLFQQTLYEGDLFVFPRGLVHFHFNPDSRQPALAYSAFNSQNPGVSQLATSLFAATPPLPEEVLEITLGIDDQGEINRLIANVSQTLV